MRRALAVALVSVLAFAACDREEAREGPPILVAPAGADAGPLAEVAPDAGTEAGPDAGPVEPPLPPPEPAFAPETAAPAAGELGLRAGAPLLREGLLRLELALGAHGNVFGVAGALRFDPLALEFVRIESTGGLEGDAAGVVIGKVSRPGRLVFAVTRKGPLPGVAIEGPRAIATLHFRSLRSGDSTLSFEKESSTVRDDALGLAAAKPAFRGGVLSIP